MAVLYRANAQSEAFERNFAALEIPFTMREDGDFYNRKEVQGLLAYLNFFSETPASNADASPPSLPGTSKEEKQSEAVSLSSGKAVGRPGYPDEWLLALLNVPNRKLSRGVGGQMKNWAEIRGKRIWDILPEFHADDLKAHRALRQMTQELQHISQKLPAIAHAGDAVRIIRSATRFDEWLKHDEKDEKDNDRIQNIQRMQAAAAHYSTIGAYLKAVQRVRDEASRRKSERAKKRREQDEVMLSTGHGAKGLEWRVVFAAGWSEELLPHRKADDINEERRIAYVIATRAKDLLCITSLDSWNDATVAPSRFVSGLQMVTTAPQPDTEIALTEAKPEDTFGGLFMAL